MASAKFSLQDSLERIQSFEETFLLANISIDVILWIHFFSLSNTDVEFAELGKLTWRFYTITEALPTISRIELIDKKIFTKAVFDENTEIFVIYFATLKAIKVAGMTIHLLRVAQLAIL